MTVVWSPPVEHQCNPGWTEFYRTSGEGGFPPAGWYLDYVMHRPGDVVECPCGRTWVALEHVYTGYRTGSGIIHGGWNDYRPETRRERRHRRRSSGDCVTTP